ncbi:MAG: AMP-binding protein, partial [bacterium]|nr:AMP-binding protein [bacterium]
MNIPIGSPINNTTVYILDKDNKTTPLGIPEELCISGVGLARGYLNKPELTAEKFVGNPFVPGQRMYRTGDLARWLPDGNLEFLRRIDNQVKIRGFRIELGEIENIILKHVDISSIVVMAKETIDGDKQLIAYYVSDSEQELSEMRDFLKKTLPDYMIPSYFIHMDSFPLTSNGKIDRDALPEPGSSNNTGVEYVAPRNEMEVALVEIWQEVLGVENIGVNDNFFELGGHSLKAVALVSRIYDIFNFHLQLKKLFENGTIEILAELISSTDDSEEFEILIPIQQKGKNPPLFLLPGNGGEVLCFSAISKVLGEDQPVYGFQAFGLDGISETIDSIEEMAVEYIRLMKLEQEKGPYFIGGHSYGGYIAFEIVRQLEKNGDIIGKLLLFDTFAPNLVKWDKTEAEIMKMIINKVADIYKIKIEFNINEISDLSDYERCIYLCKLFNKYNVSIPIDIIRGKWNVIKSANNNANVYNPQTKLQNVDVILFRAKNKITQIPNIEQKHVIEKIWNDKYYCWDKYITQDIKIYEIPGDHNSMLHNPNVKEIANIIGNLDNSV